MNPDNTWKLGLKIRKTNVRAQKIDYSALETFVMIIADFVIEDKASRPRFFQKTFIVADIKFEVILGISFFKISNVDVSFGKKTLTWKIYTTNKTLPTIKQVQIVDSKEFVIMALDIEGKTFVMHVAI